MKIDNGTLVLEKRNCHCQNGTVPGRKTCQTCHGTGRGKRGKAKGCKECYGWGWQHDFENPVTCPDCKGNPINAVPEVMGDYLPDGIWQSLPFRVERQPRAQSLNEELLGLGYVYCCTDYGKAWESTDEQVIADVKESYAHPADAITKDGELCKEILIIVKPQGYAVKAMF